MKRRNLLLSLFRVLRGRQLSPQTPHRCSICNLRNTISIQTQYYINICLRCPLGPYVHTSRRRINGTGGAVSLVLC
ncbi:hypothetical protein ARMSODRAFT_200113 [Armillaria solidipes]|uniref:Secreted protein n=1 Tax=Armillaria solidipes TaxID=1076256 RepID=A0A2H3BYE8_9AGAR|nr:hypothetical protein ARMSODRAFT_200113 [Armillaria solidipes]